MLPGPARLAGNYLYLSLMATTVLAIPPGLAWAAPIDGSDEIDRYNTYREVSQNLSPVSQILTWLGYLRLHPDTAYRDEIRWKVRYLAVLLSPEQEDILLAALAYEQLYDQVLSLEDPAQRLTACGDFIHLHPALLKEPSTADSFRAMLLRLGAVDPDTFIAAHTTGAPPLVAAAPAAPPAVAASPEPIAAESDLVGTEPSGNVAVLEPVPPPAILPEALDGIPDEPAPLPVTGEPPREKPEEVPEHVPEQGLATHEREEIRYTRWQEATAQLSPEARIQMWTTYLLLYPDTPHHTQVEAALLAARVEHQREEQQSSPTPQQVAIEQENAALRSDAEAMEQRVKSLEVRQNRRLVILVLGSLIGVLFYAANQ